MEEALQQSLNVLEEVEVLGKGRKKYGRPETWKRNVAKKERLVLTLYIDVVKRCRAHKCFQVRYSLIKVFFRNSRANF